MKNTLMLLGMSLVLIFFGCNQKKEVKDYSDFKVFYEDFQKFIAEDDLEGLNSISTENMQEFYVEHYQSHVTPEMKKAIAETQAAEVEDRNDRKLISYRVVYEEHSDFVAGYSTYGFWFENVDGIWMVCEILAAG